MQKIILYYIFTPIKDTEAMLLWQKTLTEKLNLKGRIIIAEHGLNGTVGGDINDLKQYVKQTKMHPAFKQIVFKWSEGKREDFPRMSVKVRPEIVTFGANEEIKVNAHGVVGGGTKLNPKQVNELVASRDDVVFFDGRNAYEAAVGKFKNAVIPEVAHTRDFKKEIKKPKYQKLKDKPIVTYCTGGIRCEVLSVLLKNEGFKDVYQIDGGIVKYGQEYGDDGLWEGSLYVFDGRLGAKFSDKAIDIGMCVHCAGNTSNYENCANKACNKLILICKDCSNKDFCNSCEKSALKGRAA